MSYRAICIAGEAGSGKTTAARQLAARLPGWRIVSTGQRFREYCRAHGLDPAQIAALADDLHRAVDEDMRALLATARQIIAEGRLVGWLATGQSDLLRVWCAAPLDVRAERYARRENLDLAAAREEIARRDQADAQKFQRLYGIDYRDERYYDLRVDTARLTPEQVADAILERFMQNP